MEDVPTHVLADGVTVMFATIGAVVVLVAVKEAMFPVPFAAKPMAVLSFVHVKVAPIGELVKFVVVVVAASQIILLDGTVTVGIGFTVTITVLEALKQVPSETITFRVSLSRKDEEVKVFPAPVCTELPLIKNW